MIEDYWLNALWSLLPTVVVGIIFWVVMRAILRSDRNERKAYAQVEAEQRAKLGLPPVEPSAPREV
ncbi:MULTISPECIES: hypothetical protein [Plantibacter]|uniref:Lysyl-tRNA synthetase n=2 Tax=Plantibacter TaxID=190323 RepID=A0ABY1LJ23_9MICO|nr:MULTISPECIES: hypothetical protein [unclassified Plantibacter]CAH0187289.1 hypothetical protein SRABI02_01636 [Plantibacter cousiniae]SKC47245.1 hypothetical protein SAMN06295973_1237 [Plantibacter cousiniae]SMQ72611.1 hypothetical protein SAMN06295909_2877 [Plantibacter sp. VKM Ac-1784]VXB76681.1 conserved hypothetical protein [Plantibacter sp. T3]